MTAKKKPTPKRASGGARMLAIGKKPIMIGLTADEHDLVRQAADLVGRPMAQLAKYVLLSEAKNILEKNGK